ncbi:putative ORFan [Tupanvirus deep ocean]|uniref:ORFan n=2 Tax=Tupanvirus TaxID=2094720 RepID=A0AC62A9R9_9VIRU|nr:putative ORFan [Tupanvirus deep ocean]QKU34428.1 putative ORFan [Tupanvirus deep ocean]
MKKVTFGNVQVIKYSPEKKGSRPARQSDDKLPIAAIIDATVVSNGAEPAQHFALFVKNPREGKSLLESSMYSTCVAPESLRNLGTTSSKSFSLSESCISEDYSNKDHLDGDLEEEPDYPTTEQLTAINHHEERSFMMKSCFFDLPDQPELPDEDDLIPINPHPGRSLLEESCISAKDLRRYSTETSLFTEDDLVPRNRHEGRSLLEESCYMTISKKPTSEIDSELKDFVLVSEIQTESIPAESTVLSGTSYFSTLFSYFKATNA